MDYIDTSILVYALIYGEDQKSENARKILGEIGDSKRTVTTSLVTVSELIWVLWKLTKSKQFAIKQAKSLLLLKNIRFVAVSPEISFLSLTLMNNYPALRPYDALHVATCLHEGIATIISDDSDFDGIKDLRRLPLT